MKMMTLAILIVLGLTVSTQASNSSSVTSTIFIGAATATIPNTEKAKAAVAGMTLLESKKFRRYSNCVEYLEEIHGTNNEVVYDNPDRAYAVWLDEKRTFMAACGRFNRRDKLYRVLMR